MTCSSTVEEIQLVTLGPFFSFFFFFSDLDRCIIFRLPAGINYTVAFWYQRLPRGIYEYTMSAVKLRISNDFLTFKNSSIFWIFMFRDSFLNKIFFAPIVTNCRWCVFVTDAINFPFFSPVCYFLLNIFSLFILVNLLCHTYAYFEFYLYTEKCKNTQNMN